MDYLIAALLVLANLTWLFLVVLRLPGIWLMVLTVIAVAWQRPGMFSTGVLIAVVALAVLSEVLEFAAGAVATRSVGGTIWGAIGAIVGSIVGAVLGTALIPVPVMGALAGACAGAWVATFVIERALGRKAADARRAGHAAGIGTCLGAAVKLGIGALVWVVIAVAAFWP